jgi:hypothetical protein
MSERPKLPPYSAPQWDGFVVALGVGGLGVAFAFRQAAMSAVVGVLAFVLLKLRLGRVDRWNAVRPFGERVGAGSKLNQLFAVTMLVWAASLTVYMLRAR